MADDDYRLMLEALAKRFNPDCEDCVRLQGLCHDCGSEPPC